MSIEMNLFQLKIDQKAKVLEISLPYSAKERLHSMGIIEGADIYLRKETPLGSPKIFESLNTLIAIRNRISKRIKILVEDRNEKG